MTQFSLEPLNHSLTKARQHEQTVSELTNRMNNRSSELGALQGQVDTLQGQLDTLQSQLNALKSKKDPLAAAQEADKQLRDEEQCAARTFRAMVAVFCRDNDLAPPQEPGPATQQDGPSLPCTIPGCGQQIVAGHGGLGYVHSATGAVECFKSDPLHVADPGPLGRPGKLVANGDRQTAQMAAVSGPQGGRR